MFSLLNPSSASSSSVNWKKITVEILKYALGVILGAIGVTASGCASVPVFLF